MLVYPAGNALKKTTDAYKESILPKEVTARFAIEAGATFGWKEFIGSEGDMLGIDHFGASAPAKDLFNAYGFTPENVADRVETVIAKAGVRV